MMATDQISLGPQATLNLGALINTRLLIQANSGGGKSWLLRRLLERSHGRIQQIVIDMEGEFSTLRERYDYLLVARDGDVAAEPRTAKLLAKRILELRASAIVDLYELSHQDRRRYVRLFIDALVNAPKKLWHPCMIIVDEAHGLCPEKGQAESASAIIDLATRGRKRGFCVVLATQRLSKLNKDAAAEMGNTAIGRTGLDIDMRRASDILGFTTKEQRLSLRDLRPGEFFAFGPALSSGVTKIRIGDVRTTHPQAGSRIQSGAPTPPTSRIKSLLRELQDLPQEAEKELRTITDHQAEIRRLKGEVTALKRAKPTPSTEQIQRAVDAAVGAYRKDAEPRAKAIKQAFGRLIQAFEHANLEPFREAQEAANKLMKALKAAKSVLEFDSRIKTPQIVERAEPAPLPSRIEPESGGNSEIKLTGGALRMLRVLVSRFPMQLTKAQLATFARLSVRGGTFSTYLSKLRTAGYLVEEGRLIQASETGIEALGESPSPPQSSEEVIQMWRGILRGGARRMFDALVDRYPNDLTKEELGLIVDIEPTGGTFGTYLSQLRSNSLIDTASGQIRASHNLFI